MARKQDLSKPRIRFPELPPATPPGQSPAELSVADWMSRSFPAPDQCADAGWAHDDIIALLKDENEMLRARADHLLDGGLAGMRVFADFADKDRLALSDECAQLRSDNEHLRSNLRGLEAYAYSLRIRLMEGRT